MTGAQAPVLRVPLADGTLVADAGRSFRRHDPEPTDGVRRSRHRLVRRRRGQREAGSTVVVVGDGAVGLLGVLSAKQMGAERIIAMSRHETRQKLAREFGATDIVTERGDEGVARIKETDRGHRCRLGARVRRHAGIDDAGDPFTRPGGYVGYVGVPHGVEFDGRGAVLHPRPSPRRPRAGAPLPAGADRPGLDRKINPGKVFDLTLPLEQVAEGYRAMDERRAIKTLLRP